MPLIANYDVQGVYTPPYKISLYPERAEVWVVKRNRHTGERHLQSIKHGSATFRRVLRELRQRCDVGSLAWEHLQGCADTREVR